MSRDPSGAARERAIEHEAAAWLARRDRGLSAAEQDEYFQWLADDPRHGEWLARHQRTVRGLQALAQWRPEHGTRPNPDLLAPPARRSLGRWRRAWWLASLAAAAGLTLTLWPEAPATAPAPLPPIARRVLEDDSSIDLNRGAEVEVRYTAAERRVRLVRGEAYFTVTKDPARPFTVEAGRVSVRAVGTAFNVRRQTGAVEVLVTAGVVQVNRPHEDTKLPLLEAGQRVLVEEDRADRPPQIAAVAPAEIARLLAWQPRQLEFNDTPLGQVVAEFNRDNRVKLVVDDPALAALQIGASLRSDNVEGFVRLLETSFSVRAERRGDGVIVLRPAR